MGQLRPNGALLPLPSPHLSRHINRWSSMTTQLAPQYDPAAIEAAVYQRWLDADVFTANREVMPRKGRDLPARVSLAHDVPGYFAALRKLPRVDVLPPDHVPLALHGPGYLDLSRQPTCTSYQYVDKVGLEHRWELDSNLRI